MFFEYNVLKIIIGIIIIIYGFIKSIFSIFEIFLPEKYRKSIPFITSDRTVAGLFMIEVLLAFGIYSIFHGLSILQIMPTNFNNIFDNFITTYIIYGLFGIILIIFYIYILFTNINISKDMTRISTYEIGGLSSGITFITSILVIKLYNNIFKLNIKWYDNDNILLIIGTSILTILTFFIIVKAIRRKNKNYKINIISLLPLPLPLVALY